MSERDLKNLGDLGGDLPQGLRSGRQREGSQLSSTPMNSDANGLRPRPELSQLRVPQPLNRLPDEENLWQSPMGQGYGTRLVREARSSTDFYLDKYIVESDLEILRKKVEHYGLDLHNKLDWTSLIVCQYIGLKNEIDTFKTYLVMACQIDYMIPVENLLKDLIDYKDSLEQRAIEEDSTGTFSRVDLSRRGSVISNREARNSTDYYMEKHNVEFDFEELREKVEDYGLDLRNELGWTNLIDCQYNELKNEVETFKTYMVMANQFDYMIPVDNLLKDLIDYKDSLEQRAMYENDVFVEEEVITTDNHNYGLNTTLAGLMDKEANVFVKEPEMDMVEKPEDIARISRIMKNLLKTSNDNAQISNEKYVEITSFQARTQNQLAEFQDKLELATEEIVLLRHVVSRVEGSLTKVGNGMDTVTQKCDDMSMRLSDIVKDCNTSLKGYEDCLISNEESLKQVKDSAAMALDESKVNKIMISKIKNLVTAQKNTLGQLTSQAVAVEARDNTLPANLDTQTVSVPSTLARLARLVHTGYHRLRLEIR